MRTNAMIRLPAMLALGKLAESDGTLVPCTPFDCTSEMPGAAGFTMRLAIRSLRTAPDVALTLSAKVPACLIVDTVSVERPDPVIVEGLKVAVSFAPKPVAERFT